MTFAGATESSALIDVKVVAVADATTAIVAAAVIINLPDLNNLAGLILKDIT